MIMECHSEALMRSGPESKGIEFGWVEVERR